MYINNTWFIMEFFQNLSNLFAGAGSADPDIEIKKSENKKEKKSDLEKSVGGDKSFDEFSKFLKGEEFDQHKVHSLLSKEKTSSYPHVTDEQLFDHILKEISGLDKEEQTKILRNAIKNERILSIFSEKIIHRKPTFVESLKFIFFNKKGSLKIKYGKSIVVRYKEIKKHSLDAKKITSSNFPEELKKEIKQVNISYNFSKTFLKDLGFSKKSLKDMKDVGKLHTLVEYLGNDEKKISTTKKIVEEIGNVDSFIRAYQHYENIKDRFGLEDDFGTYIEKLTAGDDAYIYEHVLNVIEDLGKKLSEKRSLEELKGHHQIRETRYHVGEGYIYIDVGKKAGGGGKDIQQLRLLNDIANKGKVLLQSTKSVEGSSKTMLEEIELVNKFNDKGIPYILPKIHDTSTDTVENQTYAVQDNLGNISAKKFFESEETTSTQFLTFISQLFVGYQAIQDENYVIGDIKDDNIMVVDGKACIIDLGGAKELNVEGKVSAIGGFVTPHYLAPEVDKEKTLTKKTDSFACGIVLLNGLSRQIGYRFSYSKNSKPTIKESIAKDPEYIKNHLKNLQEKLDKSNCTPKDREIRQGLLKICEKLLEVDPEKRISFEEANKESQKLVQEIDKKYPNDVSIESQIQF